MDHETKRELWIVSVATIVAVPLLSVLGFAAITGLIG